MFTIAASLLGSSVGRKAVIWGIAAIAVALLLWSIFSRGYNKRRMEEKMETLRSLQRRIEVDQNIRSMPISDRRDALKRWVVQRNR